VIFKLDVKPYLLTWAAGLNSRWLVLKKKEKRKAIPALP